MLRRNKESWRQLDQVRRVRRCHAVQRVLARDPADLSADEKKKLQEEGRMFREIVFLNAEVTALQSQTFEE